MKVVDEGQSCKPDIKAIAKAELKEELTGEQTKKLKLKLKELYLAKQVVENLNREIADLELEIEHKMQGI